MTSVSAATDDDIARFYGGISLSQDYMGLVRKRGRLVVAAGGIVRAAEGPWLGFMDVPPAERSISVYRHALRLLRSAREAGAPSVRVSCDHSIPRAKEFLERLGFVETDETEDEMGVWVWQE